MSGFEMEVIVTELLPFVKIIMGLWIGTSVLGLICVGGAGLYMWLSRND